MKKIMFYISTIRGGGAAKVMVNLANRFSKSGNKVYFVTNFPSDHEYELSFDIERINIEDKESRENVIVKNFKRCVTLRKILKRKHPDILISFMGENNFRALAASRFLKVKVIISVRNDPNKEYASRFSRIAVKLLYPQADGCVFQTEDAQKWFPKNVQDKSHIIFNQVNREYYETNLSCARSNIVTFGRLSEQKNHSLLIEAFAKIADEFPDENLIIYGEGPLRNNLQEQVKKLGMEKRIIMPGVIDNVAAALSKAKLFVLSSDYEGMPNALMEAMAMGLPVISTDCPCGGPRMLINNNENGILIPVDNVDALSEYIKLLITDFKLADKLGINAKKTAATFKPERVFEYWKNYLENIQKNSGD